MSVRRPGALSAPERTPERPGPGPIPPTVSAARLVMCPPPASEPMLWLYTPKLAVPPLLTVSAPDEASTLAAPACRVPVLTVVPPL